VEARILTTLDEAEALAADWDELDTAVDSPVVRHDWVMAGLEHLCGDGEALVVALFEGDDLVAAAPLSRRPGWLGRVELVGQMDHAEPGGFVYRDEGALDALAEGIADLRAPLFLRGIAADTAALLVARLERWQIRTRQFTACPTLPIPADATLETLLSSSLRSDLRRARRRARSEAGAPAFTMHLPVSADDLEPIWTEVVRIEAAGWKGRTGTALRHQKALGSFYAVYAARAAERKLLRVGIVEMAGHAAAAVVAVEWDERLWLLKTGYDERFAAASPGLLAMEGAVGHAIDQGLRSVEFLGSSAPWTRRWTEHERPFFTLRAYPPTAMGRMLLGADLGRGSLRRLAAWRSES
jgi:CelD/BcsL family acetyltransferase involved in cellulose biosynthesis